MEPIEKGKISGSQSMWLMVNIVLPTAVLFIPALTIKNAGTSAWISVGIVGTLWGLIVIWVCTSLGQRFPTKELTDYSREILGNFFGRLIGLFYIFVSLYVNSIIVREFGEFLVTAFMPETPLVVFNFLILVLAASAVRNGLEVIARMNHFVISLMFGALAFIFILVITEADFGRLLPILENGFKPVMLGSLTPMGWRGEVFLILILMPYLNNFKEARTAGFKAIFLLSLVLAIDTIMAIVVFGLHASHYVFPIHTLGTYISVGGFLERVEPFILALWVSGVTMKVCIWYYCGSVITAGICNLKDYKPIVIPLGIIQLVWSITAFDNIRQLVEFFSGAWIGFSFFFELIVPLSLLLIGILRKKGRKRT